jgi:hypothetical protein
LRCGPRRKGEAEAELADRKKVTIGRKNRHWALKKSDNWLKKRDTTLKHRRPCLPLEYRPGLGSVSYCATSVARGARQVGQQGRSHQGRIRRTRQWTPRPLLMRRLTSNLTLPGHPSKHSSATRMWYLTTIGVRLGWARLLGRVSACCSALACSPHSDRLRRRTCFPN